MVEKAVLFDVQDTLIREAKDVSQYYFEAIRSTYGLSIDDIDLSKYEGSTVQETLIDILEKNGQTRDEIYAKLELFIEELTNAHYNVAGHDKAILADGAKNLLNNLNKDKNFVIGAASGQVDRILINQFDRVGLKYDSYFKFGAYGDTAEHITKILETAIDVAMKEYGVKKDHITFISNSKKHVAAAHAFGINAIGVITDEFSRKDLESLGMRHVVKSLNDCRKLIK